jgi:ligand-binding sensor domain-containing protein/signal transduction histidine kinase
MNCRIPAILATTRRRILGAMIAAMLAAADEGRGAGTDFSSRVWQMEDGLPHNIVQAIAQTADGYLWVGTREGLARFDGFRFERIDVSFTRNFSSIHALLAAKDASLWVGSDGAGLFRLQQQQVFVCPGPKGETNFIVSEIHEAAAGDIWVAANIGVLRYRQGQAEFITGFNNLVQSLCVDPAGDVWLAGNGAMKCLSRPELPNLVPTQGILPNDPRRAYCDPQGKFWLAARGGLTGFEDPVATFVQKAEGPTGFIGAMLVDRQQNFWIGTYSGLSRFENGNFVNFGTADESAYRIFALFQDREETLWVGSEEGLIRMTPKRFQTITKKDGLTHNTVVSVCAGSDGSIWIGAWGGGINRLRNGQITALTKNDGLSSDFVMGICEGRDGSLWVGTDYGAALNQIQGSHITQFGADAGFSGNIATIAMLEDAAGNLWVGTRSGLYRRQDGQFTRYSTKSGLPHNRINALCEGADGAIWIGTDDGILRWTAAGFATDAALEGLRQTTVLSIFQDAAGVLWIGTKNQGLFRWRAGRLDVFTSAGGLFSDSIYSILEDQRDNLWLNSSRGIFRIAKKQFAARPNRAGPEINSISYGKEDGVISSSQYRDVTQPSACRGRDGRLWFRTTQGAVVVDPNEITTNELPPPVVIQEVIIDKKSLEISAFQPESARRDSAPATQIIPPGRGEVEIHYAALSYRAPEKNRYRYKLEGVETEWVEAGTRRITYYNNLRPGKYRFVVQATNNDGVWSEIGGVLPFLLQPHFWQTWWFYAGGVVSSAGIIALMVRNVTRRRMQRKFALLEQQNAVERERARIARDMHDELGAKLTHISFQGATATRNLGNPAAAQIQIEKMAKTARELVSSLDEIVWAVDPGNDSLENLASYIYRFASEFFENTPVQCQFSIPTQLPAARLATDVRHNVFLAVKEILNNTLKHAQATRIELTIAAADEGLTIVMADNGQGMVLSEHPETDPLKRTGHGLTNVRQRLHTIGGAVALESNPGTGTKVSLTVPLPRAIAPVMRT